MYSCTRKSALNFGSHPDKDCMILTGVTRTRLGGGLRSLSALVVNDVMSTEAFIFDRAKTPFVGQL